MHAYNQGIGTVNDFMGTSSHEIFLLQDLEHWVLPTNLGCFNEILDYFACSSSSINSIV